jgi:uncharacterized YkwD family protein
MRKYIRGCGLIFWVVLLSVMLTVPAYAAVPHHKNYRLSPWYWFDWPVISRPAVPPLPRDSKPVQTPPNDSGADNQVRELTSDENYVLKQVNAERAEAGLTPLKIDYRLVQTARAKSNDMIRGHYFDHQSPTLGSPFDQMKKAGIAYRYAGENIAGNPSAAGAMTSWMNSSGHRANILNPDFKHIGIGVVDGGPYGKMLTQQFIG